MSVLEYRDAHGEVHISAKELAQGVATCILMLSIVAGIGIRNWIRGERNTLLLILLILALFFVTGLIRPVS